MGPFFSIVPSVTQICVSVRVCAHAGACIHASVFVFSLKPRWCTAQHQGHEIEAVCFLPKTHSINRKSNHCTAVMQHPDIVNTHKLTVQIQQSRVWGIRGTAHYRLASVRH